MTKFYPHSNSAPSKKTTDEVVRIHGPGPIKVAAVEVVRITREPDATIKEQANKFRLAQAEALIRAFLLK